MVAINVTDRAGQKLVIQASAGTSLMEPLRDNEKVEAICGGCCSCATCHVFVDPAWMAKLPARTEFEQELLLTSDSYQPDASRLSCQVTLTDSLDGLTVTVAPAD